MSKHIYVKSIGHVARCIVELVEVAVCPRLTVRRWVR